LALVYGGNLRDRAGYSNEVSAAVATCVFDELLVALVLEDAIVVVVEVELVVDDSPAAKATTDDEAVLINATANTNLENNFICVFRLSLFANLV
jgi:hypothetical protein